MFFSVFKWSKKEYNPHFFISQLFIYLFTSPRPPRKKNTLWYLMLRYNLNWFSYNGGMWMTMRRRRGESLSTSQHSTSILYCLLLLSLMTLEISLMIGNECYYYFPHNYILLIRDGESKSVLSILCFPLEYNNNNAICRSVIICPFLWLITSCKHSSTYPKQLIFISSYYAMLCSLLFCLNFFKKLPR